MASTAVTTDKAATAPTSAAIVVTTVADKSCTRAAATNDKPDGLD